MKYKCLDKDLSVEEGCHYQSKVSEKGFNFICFECYTIAKFMRK